MLALYCLCLLQFLLETTLFQKKTHLRKQVGCFVGNNLQKVLSESNYQFLVNFVVRILNGIDNVVDCSNNILMTIVTFASVGNRFMIAVSQAPVPLTIRTLVGLKVR